MPRTSGSSVAASEDLVLVTTIDMTKLPTEFDKWIEKDLLKLSTFDVARVVAQVVRRCNRRSAAWPKLPRQLDAELDYDSSEVGMEELPSCSVRIANRHSAKWKS